MKLQIVIDNENKEIIDLPVGTVISFARCADDPFAELHISRPGQAGKSFDLDHEAKVTVLL